MTYRGLGLMFGHSKKTQCSKLLIQLQTELGRMRRAPYLALFKLAVAVSQQINLLEIVSLPEPNEDFVAFENHVSVSMDSYR